MYVHVCIGLSGTACMCCAAVCGHSGTVCTLSRVETGEFCSGTYSEVHVRRRASSCPVLSLLLSSLLCNVSPVPPRESSAVGNVGGTGTCVSVEEYMYLIPFLPLGIPIGCHVAASRLVSSTHDDAANP